MTRTPRPVELLTLALTAGVYAAWLGATLAAGAGAWWAYPLLVVVLALHASLQHEHIHGHPTRNPTVNAWLAGWPLSLWLPYTVYRRTHRAHHAAPALTDPIDDPESYYVDGRQWAEMGWLARGIRAALQTLLGRLVLGPAVVIAETLAGEVRRWRALDATTRRRERPALLAHAAGVAGVIAWLWHCGLSPLGYALGAVYPALSLTLLRSYVEHRPDADPALRTSVVESRWLGWLFLHNNLHVVHHDAPGLPWYALPARWRRERDRYVKRGVRVFSGYRSLLHHLVAPKDPPVHPDSPAVADRAAVTAP